MKFHARALAFVALVVASPSATQAATTIFAANLTGAQQVPPVATPGTGTATVSYDDVTNILSVQATFSGLLSPTSIAHIHCCAPLGSNAGVATPVPSFPGFPMGVTTGSYSRSLDLTQASSFNPAFVTANGGTPASAAAALVNGLRAGQAYFNIHSERFPAGEIRGQFGAVPEPATWAMMIGGLGMVGGALRSARRRRIALA